jgi:chloride channel 3/4/5
MLSLSQGVLGSLFIRLNIKVAVHRQKSVLGDWPLVEVIIVSAGTAIISFVVSDYCKWDFIVEN